MSVFTRLLVAGGVLLDAHAYQRTGERIHVRVSGNGRGRVSTAYPAINRSFLGSWTIQVRTTEEAIQWALRWPSTNDDGGWEIELRQVIEPGSCAPCGPHVRLAHIETPQS